MKNFTLFDEKFNLIKTIAKVNCGKGFRPYAISTNQKNQLYISNPKDHKILLTESFGSLGNGNDQFCCPSGICFKNNHLYSYKFIQWI